MAFPAPIRGSSIRDRTPPDGNAPEPWRLGRPQLALVRVLTSACHRGWLRSGDGNEGMRCDGDGEAVGPLPDLTRRGRPRPPPRAVRLDQIGSHAAETSGVYDLGTGGSPCSSKSMPNSDKPDSAQPGAHHSRPLGTWNGLCLRKDRRESRRRVVPATRRSGRRCGWCASSERSSRPATGRRSGSRTNSGTKSSRCGGPP